ncbi:MAG: isoprenylcysteine carboxylmethyltransferase family protein [Acidobacteriota bacterium]
MYKEKMKAQLWFRSIVGIAALIVFLFAAGGHLDYWQGWAYIGLNVFFLGLTNWVLRNEPSLRSERMAPGAGIKWWDKVYYIFSVPLYFICLTVAGLDGGRYHWTPHVPLALYLAVIIAYILGQSLTLWAKTANRFFSSVVRIQLDRGQTVCAEGPYRYVRHPGYLGGLLFGLSAPLLLGSAVALIPAGLAALSLLVRTLLEDNTLLAELDGYKQYANAVKFRLLPYIW